MPSAANISSTADYEREILFSSNIMLWSLSNDGKTADSSYWRGMAWETTSVISKQRNKTFCITQ